MMYYFEVDFDGLGFIFKQFFVFYFLDAVIRQGFGDMR